MTKILFMLGSVLAICLYLILKFIDELLDEYGEKELMGTDRSNLQELAYGEDEELW